MTGKTYYSFNDYMHDTFGYKVYKISLDGGFTCPNRDGTKDTRGCIFCLNGSGDFCPDRSKSIKEQSEEAKRLVKSKNAGGKYMAYFQSYTGTYAPVSYLRKVYTEAIGDKDIVAVSIGTRPDCLPYETVSLLSELSKIKPVYVELGLQTIHKKTADYIRRGYDLPVFEDAMERLKKAGIPVTVHMIIGLPGESTEDMTETAEYIGKSGAFGVKFQLLHVLRGTDLEKDYEKGLFTLPTMEEYGDILTECMKKIPRDMVVQRITGDGDKKFLIAPMWSADKKRVLNYLNKRLEVLYENKTEQ